MTIAISRRLAAAFATAAYAALVPFAASAQGLEKFAARAETSTEIIDYAPLDKYLDVFGVPANKRLKFNFAASKDAGTDFLRQYTEALSKIAPASLSGDDQLAYWLNMRNMLVLAHLSETGGRVNLKKDRGTGAAPGAAWTAKVITVDGAPLSIDDIERGIILANWKDARVLYGFYQGAAGGPAAAQKAFRGETVWTELSAAGKRYMTSDAGFELTKKAAVVSAIFDWYGAEVFNGDEALLRAHVVTLITHGAQINLKNTPIIQYKEFNYKPETYVVRTVSTPAPVQSGPDRSFPTGS